MSWYSIVVTPDEQTNGVSDDLFATFSSLQNAASLNSGEGMWLKRETQTGNVTYFLSPQAYEISRLSMLKFRPQPCETPNVKNLVPSVVRHA